VILVWLLLVWMVVDVLVGDDHSLSVLHLTHMELIGVRELQQHASAALRRVERGETLGVTDRGRLVAVLAPPSAATGAGALLASGRVQPASRTVAELTEPTVSVRDSSEVLDELRAER
jgi:antitoxin (DNA-binding transcriptional repressor) of toxin-antitoxin stability system